ncbi:piggyBac transposable element-derived protein 3-like, partial [Clarias magur]
HRILSILQSFVCLITMDEMLMTIRDCTVHEGHRADPSWSLSLYELISVNKSNDIPSYRTE